MNFPIRRMTDGVAGAIIATVLLAGGAAYAATTGFDDHPKGDTAATDDSFARGNPASGTTDDSTTPGSSSTSSSTSVTTPSTSTPSTSTPSTSTPSSSTTVLPPPTGGATYPVLDAGTVTVAVDGTVLHVVSATPSAGWVVRVERDDAREVEVSFLSGSARVDFNAELEDDEVRVRVRDRRAEVAPSTTAGASTSSTTPPVSTTDASATVRTFQGKGGSVTVRSAGSGVALVAATPASGYGTDVRSSGPDKVEVRFTSGRSETRIEIEREHGAWRERVEDR